MVHIGGQEVAEKVNRRSLQALGMRLLQAQDPRPAPHKQLSGMTRSPKSSAPQTRQGS